MKLVIFLVCVLFFGGSVDAKPRALKGKGGKGGKKKLVLYGEYFSREADPPQYYVATKPLFASYDGTGVGGLSDKVGDGFLTVITYNYPVPSGDNFVNDNKITFITDDGVLIFEGVFSFDYPQPVAFALVGGTGKYVGAVGEILISTDTFVNIYTIKFK